MSDAFRAIADAYDLLLDEQRLQRELPGLLDLLAAALRIADLGCGTGDHAAALQAAGRDLLAVDFEPAMVEQARSRHPRLAVERGDLTAPPSGPWDALICLGNVLACLPGEALDGIAAAWHAALAPGGRAIVQIVNPLRAARDLSVVRRDGHRILIKTLAALDDGALLSLLLHERQGEHWRSHASHQRLHRHHPTALADAFRRAGFPHVTFRGALDGRPFDEESPDLVLLASLETL